MVPLPPPSDRTQGSLYPVKLPLQLFLWVFEPGPHNVAQAAPHAHRLLASVSVSEREKEKEEREGGGRGREIWKEGGEGGYIAKANPRSQ